MNEYKELNNTKIDIDNYEDPYYHKSLLYALSLPPGADCYAAERARGCPQYAVCGSRG